MSAPTLEWRLANPFGIQVDEAADAWHAGHTADAIALADGTVVAASQTSGVWLLRGDATQRLDVTGLTGTLRCLAKGPDRPAHVLAAGDALHVTCDLHTWSQVALPPGATSITGMATTGATRRLYVASDAGLFWCELPAEANGAYVWQPASPALAFRSVCVWPDRTRWRGWQPAQARPIDTASPVRAVCRVPAHLDLFTVDRAGQVHSSWGGSSGDNLQPWFSLGESDRMAVPGRLSAVARHPDALDVIALAPDGSARSVWWPAGGGGWSPWFTVGRPGADRFDLRAEPCLVSRTSESLDVLAATADGRILHNQRAGPGPDTWRTWRPVGTPADRFDPRGGVTAVARARGPHLDRFQLAPGPGPGTSHLDIFAVTPSGQVRTTWTDDAGATWGSWYTVGNESARFDPASRIAAVSRRADHLDVFARGLDGGIYSTWWHQGGGWAPWFRVGGGVISSGTPITCVAPNPEELLLAVLGTDNAPWTTAWTPDTGWSGWTPLAAPTPFEPPAGVTAVAPRADEVLLLGASGGTPVLNRRSPGRDRVVASAVKGAGDAATAPLWQGAVEADVTVPATTQVTPATSVAGLDTTAMGTTTVAGSAHRPGRAYAVSADAAGLVLGVLTTVDGGATWTGCGTQVTAPGAPTTLMAAAGDQGQSWNNCLGVGPSDPNVAMIGWVDRFVTRDGGQTWQRFLVDSPHSHADHHAMRFDLLDSTGSSVLISSDGGVCVTRDLGATAGTRCNRRYANLQFYARDSRRMSYGGGASGTVPGLMAGGTQDNANLFCELLPAPGPWRRVDSGDGGLCMFLRSGELISSRPFNGLDYERAHFDESTRRFVGDGVVPVTRHKPGDEGRRGMYGPGAVVNQPVDRDVFGAKILAVACPFPSGDVYTGWSANLFNPFRWEYEVTLPLAEGEAISAMSSANSDVIFCGTSSGQIFAVDSRARTSAVMPVSAPVPNRTVNAFAVVSDTRAYALYSDKDTDDGAVLRLADGVWSAVGGLPDTVYFGVDIDWTLPRPTVFVCNDTDVFASADEGATWQPVDRGLPPRPLCADLRFAVQPGGRKVLSLSTYGHSLWVSDLR